MHTNVGDIHTIAISHGEGRFVASEQLVKQLAENGQIATQYVDLEGNPTEDYRFNPNGSIDASRVSPPRTAESLVRWVIPSVTPTDCT